MLSEWWNDNYNYGRSYDDDNYDDDNDNDNYDNEDNVLPITMSFVNFDHIGHCY